MNTEDTIEAELLYIESQGVSAAAAGRLRVLVAEEREAANRRLEAFDRECLELGEMYGTVCRERNAYRIAIESVLQSLTVKCDVCGAPRTLGRFNGYTVVGKPNRWCEEHRPATPLWTKEELWQPREVPILRGALESVNQ